MFENPRRGRRARNFTTNAPKILDLKSSSEQIFSRKLPLGAPVEMTSKVQNLQLACGSEFHLSFEDFDIISVIDKIIHHGKLLSISYSPYKVHCM